MLKHIVFWKLKPECRTESVFEELRDRLQGLKTLDSVTSIEVGHNLHSIPGGWDVALVSEFESEQHLTEYQTHPRHVDVKAFIENVTSDRAVVDYVVN